MNNLLIKISFFTLAVLMCLACGRSTESPSKNKEGASDQVAVPRKLFAGHPDLPAHPYQITSAGMGQILLGDKVENLCRIYSCDSSQTGTAWEEGKEWPSRKILLGNYFLLAEMINTVGIISKLSTNDPRFKTHNNIHAGLLIDSLPALKDSLQANPEHKAFTYGREGVWFKTDPKTESKYFMRKDPDISYLQEGRIEEVFIICADC